jgi:hypothetical protein
MHMDRQQKLSNQAIDEFKQIYHSEFAEMLPDATAEEMAMQVLRLFALLSGFCFGDGKADSNRLGDC